MLDSCFKMIVLKSVLSVCHGLFLQRVKFGGLGRWPEPGRAVWRVGSDSGTVFLFQERRPQGLLMWLRIWALMRQSSVPPPRSPTWSEAACNRDKSPNLGSKTLRLGSAPASGWPWVCYSVPQVPHLWGKEGSSFDDVVCRPGSWHFSIHYLLALWNQLQK